MTKPAQLREMSSDQLHFQLREVQQNLFKLRFQSATEKLDAPSNLRKFWREIARIKTVIRLRELKTGELKTAELKTGEKAGAK